MKRWAGGVVVCAAFAVALASLQAAAVTAQGASKPQAGERVNPDAKALAALEERIKGYMDLHNKVKAKTPSASKEATPTEIDRQQRAFGVLLRRARSTAKQGDIFTPDARAVIRRLLLRVFSGPDGAQSLSAIMDENPGPIRIQVNGRYPDTVPLSTMPPQVLEGLPKLPEQLEFRFLGRRMILLDVPAHLIVDYVDNALPLPKTK